MGGAFIAIANDGSSIYYNPAGVAISEDGLLSFMYSSHFGGIADPLASFFHFGFIKSVQKREKILHLGVNISGVLTGFSLDRMLVRSRIGVFLM